MTFRADKSTFDGHEITPTAFRLFDYFCMRGGRDNPTCTASLERASSDLHMGYSYASRKRAELVRAGWILLKGGTVYILKGIEEYTDEAQKIVAKIAIEFADSGTEVAKKAIAELLKKQVKIAKIASENCENSKSLNKDEPAPLTSPLEPTKNTGAAAPPMAAPQPGNVSRIAEARTESDHQRGMRELASLTGAIPDGKAQGGALKWLLDNDYSIQDCVECLQELVAQLRDPVHWRDSRVSWLTVRKEIGGWKLKREGRAESTQSGGKSNEFNGRSQTSSSGNYAEATGRQLTRRERNRAERIRQLNEVTFDSAPTCQTG